MKIIIAALLLSSCALFQSQKKNTSPTLVTGGGAETKMSSDEIAHHLTRETSMGGGIYEIKAMPLTEPYLTQRWNELANARAFGEKDFKRAKQWHVDRFLGNRTCIDMHYNVTRFEQSKYLDQWKLIIEVDGDNIEMEWLPESQHGEAFVSEVLTPTHPDKRWHNRGIACAPVNLPIYRGFSLQVKTVYVPWPFSEEANLEWVFEALNPEDEAAVEERKKKNFQKYRGW